MGRYTRIDSGLTSRGEPWQVGLAGERLVIMQGRLTIGVEGAEREKFAEAVARAVTARPHDWDAPAAEPTPAEELRVRVHQHLKRYPRLTVHEIARALQVSETRVRRLLPAMEADGEAARETGPKCEGDTRPATRWTAT